MRPKGTNPWGEKARAALTQRLSGQEIALDVVTQDRYERLVAVAYLGDENLNARMVQQGHAWAYRQYLADPEYCRLEHDARRGRRGLWSLDRPLAPWEWRRRPQSFADYSDETPAGCIAAKGRSTSTRTAAPATSDQPSGQCIIKGNVSKNGRIYHVPGSRSYDATKVDESNGERWFCTEVEARAAGWRLASD